MPSGTCQMAYSVASGAASAITGRIPGRDTATRKAPMSRISAGGMMISNIVVPVVVLGALYQEAQQLREQHHGDAGAEAVERVEAQPAVRAEMPVHLDEQLRRHGQAEHQAEDPPQPADRAGPHQPVVLVRVAFAHCGTSRIPYSRSTTGPL